MKEDHASEASQSPDAIVWIGKMPPNYPMRWRVLLGLSAAVAAPVLTFLLAVDAGPFAVAFLGGWVAVLACVYLMGVRLERRTGGGPECFFAVSGEGVRFHAGPELRDLGRMQARTAALAQGNLVNLLMLESAEHAHDLYMAWNEVRSVEIRSDLLLVFVSRGLRGPIPLFCTRENFDAVCRLVLQRAAHARLKGDIPDSHRRG